MRYFILAAALSGVIVLALAGRHRADDMPAVPEILALTAPHTIGAEERVTVYGGMVIPEGRYELDMYACQAGRCSRSLWLTAEGPAELWRSFGTVSFTHPDEPATVELRAFRADGVTDAVIAEWSQDVVVLEAAEGQ